MSHREIPEATHDRIRELLTKTDRSCRSIAAEVGVSGSTVVLESQRLGVPRGQGNNPTGRRGKCLWCNRIVELPCLACQMRRMIRAGEDQRVYGSDAGELATFGLDLHGDDLRRYHEVRRWRGLPAESEV